MGFLVVRRMSFSMAHQESIVTTPLHLCQKPELSLDEARMLLALQQHLDLISEGIFQRVIIAEAKPHGWLCHAERPARSDKGWRTPIQGDPGFQDLVLARAGVVWLWECKTEDGKVTADQLAWFKEAGSHAGIIKPSDWPRIKEALA